jgi:hypothetical protein
MAVYSGSVAVRGLMYSNRVPPPGTWRPMCKPHSLEVVHEAEAMCEEVLQGFEDIALQASRTEVFTETLPYMWRIRPRSMGPVQQQKLMLLTNLRARGSSGGRFTEQDPEPDMGDDDGAEGGDVPQQQVHALTLTSKDDDDAALMPPPPVPARRGGGAGGGGAQHVHAPEGAGRRTVAAQPRPASPSLAACAEEDIEEWPDSD